MRRDRLWVLIPGQHVLMTTVAMPKINRQELEKAIPFDLEENNWQDDIANYYFATGEI